MKIKKFCATATLLAAACAMQAGAMAADTPTAAATAGTATQSTVGTAVTATNQTASTDAATGELLPSDVQTSSDGLQLKKIYDVGKPPRRIKSRKRILSAAASSTPLRIF